MLEMPSVSLEAEPRQHASAGPAQRAAEVRRPLTTTAKAKLQCLETAGWTSPRQMLPVKYVSVGGVCCWAELC